MRSVVFAFVALAACSETYADTEIDWWSMGECSALYLLAGDMDRSRQVETRAVQLGAMESDSGSAFKAGAMYGNGKEVTQSSYFESSATRGKEIADKQLLTDVINNNCHEYLAK